MKRFLTFLFFLVLTMPVFAQGFGSGNGYDNGLGNGGNSNNGGGWTLSNPNTTTTYNVGIGTTVPGTALYVNGTAKANALILNGAGAGSVFSPNGLQFDPNNGTGTSLNPLVTLSSAGYMAIDPSGATLNEFSGAALGIHGLTFVGNIPNSGSANNLCFNMNGTNFGCGWNKTTDSTEYFGPTTDKTISPTTSMLTLAFDTGNVGINTLVPHYQLDVQGTVRATGLVIPGNSVANNFVWTSTGTDGSAHWAAASGGGSSLWNTINTNDLYEANGSTYGNVGIGTSLTSNASLTILKNSTTPYMFVNSTSGGGGNVFTITNGGNVGIGSATPGQALDVQGTVRTTGFSMGGVTSTTVTGTGAVTLGTAPTISSPVITNLAPAADFTLTQNSVAAITSKNSGAVVNTLYLNAGNVGIGTTTMTNALVVNGTGQFLGTGASYTNGNLGIGSTTPGQALDVQGTVRISNATPMIFTACKATTGTRYVCVDTSGNISCSASACSGT